MIILFSAVLIIFSFYSLFTQQKLYYLYFVFLVFLGVLSSIRFSVGTDYFSYAYIYDQMPLKLSKALNSPLHGEIGFKFLIVLFKNWGLSYQIFLAIFSITTLLFLHKILKDYSPIPILSLTIFNHLYYHIYVNSGIRQGLTMVLILYAVTYYLAKEQYIKFTLFLLLATTIHFSALIALVLIPAEHLFKRLKRTKNQLWLYLFLVLTAGFILVANLINLGDRLAQLLPLTIDYRLGTGINWLAFFSKLIVFIFISFFYLNDVKEKTRVENLYFMSFFIGTIIYFVFVTSPMVSRLLDVFTITEVVLVPMLLYKKNILLDRVLYFYLIVSITGVFLLKDLESFAIQQEYYQENMITYRYFTIFNKNKRFIYKPPHRLEKYLPEKY